MGKFGEVPEWKKTLVLASKQANDAGEKEAAMVLLYMFKLSYVLPQLFGELHWNFKLNYNDSIKEFKEKYE